MNEIKNNICAIINEKQSERNELGKNSKYKDDNKEMSNQRKSQILTGNVENSTGTNGIIDLVSKDIDYNISTDSQYPVVNSEKPSGLVISDINNDLQSEFHKNVSESSSINDPKVMETNKENHYSSSDQSKRLSKNAVNKLSSVFDSELSTELCQDEADIVTKVVENSSSINSKAGDLNRSNILSWNDKYLSYINEKESCPENIKIISDNNEIELYKSKYNFVPSIRRMWSDEFDSYVKQCKIFAEKQTYWNDVADRLVNYKENEYYENTNTINSMFETSLIDNNDNLMKDCKVNTVSEFGVQNDVDKNMQTFQEFKPSARDEENSNNCIALQIGEVVTEEISCDNRFSYDEINKLVQAMNKKRIMKRVVRGFRARAKANRNKRISVSQLVEFLKLQSQFQTVELPKELTVENIGIVMEIATSHLNIKEVVKTEEKVKKIVKTKLKSNSDVKVIKVNKGKSHGKHNIRDKKGKFKRVLKKPKILLQLQTINPIKIENVSPVSENCDKAKLNCDNFQSYIEQKEPDMVQVLKSCDKIIKHNSDSSDSNFIKEFVPNFSRPEYQKFSTTPESIIQTIRSKISYKTITQNHKTVSTSSRLKDSLDQNPLNSNRV